MAGRARHDPVDHVYLCPLIKKDVAEVMAIDRMVYGPDAWGELMFFGGCCPEHHHICVARCSDRTVGYVIYEVAEDACYIWRIGLVKASRSTIGCHILRELIERAHLREQEHQLILAECRTDNRRLKALLKDIGFRYIEAVKQRPDIPPLFLYGYTIPEE